MTSGVNSDNAFSRRPDFVLEVFKLKIESIDPPDSVIRKGSTLVRLRIDPPLRVAPHFSDETVEKEIGRFSA